MATTIVTKDSLLAAIKRLWSRVLHLDGKRRADISELKESIEQTASDLEENTKESCELLESSINSKLMTKLDTKSYVVDTALSSTSTNPVQNKVVDTAISDAKTELKGTSYDAATTGDSTIYGVKKLATNAANIAASASSSATNALGVANAAKTAAATAQSSADAAQSSADSKLSEIAVNIYDTENEYADGTSADKLNIQDSKTIQPNAVTIESDTEAKHGISLSVKLKSDGGLEETDTGIAVKVDEHYGLAINSSGNLVVRTDGSTISNSDGLSVLFADEGVASGVDEPVSSSQVYEAIQKVKTIFVAATGSHTVPSGTNEAIAVVASNTMITLPGTGTNGQLVYIVALASATNSTLLVSDTSAGATATRWVNGTSGSGALTLNRCTIYTCLYMSDAWYISYQTS